MIHYLKLFRLDVALISFFSYIVGSAIADNREIKNIFIAVLLTLISTNFIYSFNSWADWKIDKINKPWRPIPSGKIKPEAALFYSVVLLFLSCIYPFFIFKSYLTLLLFLLLPLLGILYSGKPFYIKKYPIPAIFIISIGLITPISLGYFMNKGDTSIFPFFIALFLYSLSIVPFKDIEDVEGDLKNNIINLFGRFSEKLLVYSMSILFLNCLVVLIFPINIILRTFLLILIFSSFLLILIFWILKKNLTKLYCLLIHLVIFEAILYLIILSIRGGI